jgi:hypothetical protein
MRVFIPRKRINQIIEQNFFLESFSDSMRNVISYLKKDSSILYQNRNE